MQRPMTPEWEKEIKDNYDEIIQKCRNHVFGMAFDSPVGRNAVDTPPKNVKKYLKRTGKVVFDGFLKHSMIF